MSAAALSVPEVRFAELVPEWAEGMITETDGQRYVWFSGIPPKAPPSPAEVEIEEETWCRLRALGHARWPDGIIPEHLQDEVSAALLEAKARKAKARATWANTAEGRAHAEVVEAYWRRIREAQAAAQSMQ